MSPDVQQLIAEHVKEQGEVSGISFALPANELVDPAIKFVTARDDNGVLLGMAALKDHHDGTAELKSMRTTTDARGTGVGSALLKVVVEMATARGFSQLNLETGTEDHFTPARGLYEKHGFSLCRPFADYPDVPSSCYYTLDLQGTTILVTRRLVPEDAAVMAALESDVFGPDAWSEALLSEELRSPWSTYLGVFDAGTLIAYGGVKGDQEGDLMTIGVIPEHRGSGVGSALLQDLLEVAHERGIGELFLEVRASNKAARALYQNAGFEELARVSSYYRHPTEDAVTMRLELTD